MHKIFFTCLTTVSFAFFFLIIPVLSHGAGDESIFFEVPFLSQAPTFQWKDDRFQSACEEASVLMALAWAGVRQLPVGRAARAKEILVIGEFEADRYGVYHDTSPYDTARFARDYSSYKGFSVQPIRQWQDIVSALARGLLVIVPADGRVLKNPNFTGQGPEEHMLVIRGYDYNTQEFIANDPGTRKGEGWRYHRRVLFAAVRDYKTGKHEKGRPRTKSMIVVKRMHIQNHEHN